MVPLGEDLPTNYDRHLRVAFGVIGVALIFGSMSPAIQQAVVGEPTNEVWAQLGLAAIMLVATLVWACHPVALATSVIAAALIVFMTDGGIALIVLAPVVGVFLYAGWVTRLAVACVLCGTLSFAEAGHHRGLELATEILLCLSPVAVVAFLAWAAVSWVEARGRAEALSSELIDALDQLEALRAQQGFVPSREIARMTDANHDHLRRQLTTSLKHLRAAGRALFADPVSAARLLKVAEGGVEQGVSELNGAIHAMNHRSATPLVDAISDMARDWSA